jgi:RHS repeat-associated protein
MNDTPVIMHVSNNLARSYRYGYQGSERDDEIKGNGNQYTTYFRGLDPRLGRWLSVDPKASSLPWQSPYCSMDNNPIALNDVKGDKTEDWVKNEKTGKITWDKNAKDQSTTAIGSKYIGSKPSDIVEHFFGKTQFSKKTEDVGIIDIQSFENPYSASGTVPNYLEATTTMQVNLKASIKDSWGEDGSYAPEFKGITASVIIYGEVIAPYPNMNLALKRLNMTANGGEIIKDPYSGPVFNDTKLRALSFQTTFDAQSIQGAYGTSGDQTFTFKGIYTSGGSILKYPIGLVGALGVVNTTNITLKIPFNSAQVIPKLYPGKNSIPYTGKH